MILFFITHFTIICIFYIATVILSLLLIFFFTLNIVPGIVFSVSTVFKNY